MKKPKLTNKNIIPYGGGFRITDPATGVASFGLDFGMLVSNMSQVRRSNGVPIGIEFEDEVEQWCCRDNPAACTESDPDVPTRRNLTLADVINGTKVMAAFKLAGSPIVDRTEAERRAVICKACPFNQIFSKPCAGICQELRDVVTSIVGAQGTQYDGYLNACSICGCFLMAAIWLPLDIQCKGVSDQMKRRFANVATGCWKQCA